MRYLFVCDVPPDPNSGAAGSLAAIAEALRRRGSEVDHLWREDMPFRLPHPALQRLYEQPRRQYLQVARALAQTAYDVVIISQPYAARVFEALPGRYPHTLFLNRTHGWEERFAESDRRLGLLPPGSRVLRWLSGVRTSRLSSRTVRGCHGLIAACTLCADYIRARYPAAAEKVAVIPYGLDAAFRTAPAGERPARRELRLLFVGQYQRRKGAETLERVLPELARFHRFSATFVVPQTSAADVDRCFGPVLKDRLSVVSWLERSQLRDLYLEHDVLLFPSLFDGFAKVVLEAMACGLCVVGYEEGGLADVAHHGREALFCPPGDVHSFRRLLESCLEDPEEARRIGERGRIAARRFTWDETARKTEEWCAGLRETLGGRRTAGV